MKIVWKPLDDVRIILGLNLRKIDKNIKFVKYNEPYGTAVINGKLVTIQCRTYRSEDNNELLEYFNKSFISHVFYFKHEYRNIVDEFGTTKTILVVRFYSE